MRADMRILKALLTVWLLVVLLPMLLWASEGRQKVILDADLGGDIDDAFALALILASPEFELLGVVMDHGLTEKRAQIACRMLYETGFEQVPVAVGRQTPNVVGRDTRLAGYSPQFHWAEGFTKKRPIATPAADFIIETLRKYPNEVILFTVGPVPNLADVVRKDPEALKLAKGVYSMFGSFYMGYGRDPVPSAEWNVRADAASAQKFAASGAEITYAGLDITTFVKLEADRRLELAMRHSPLTDAVSGLYTLWGQETPVLYDAVAVGMVLWPELFQTRPAHVRVTDEGFTLIDESRPPNSKIGMTIRTEEFLSRMMERLLRQNLAR